MEKVDYMRILQQVTGDIIHYLMVAAEVSPTLYERHMNQRMLKQKN